MNRALGLAMLAVLALGSCESPAPTASGYTPVVQRSVAPATAFDVAVAVVSEHFPIEVADPVRGLIRTATVQAVVPAGSRRLGDAIGNRRQARKWAEVRIEPAGEGSSIWCKVVIEENQTQAHRMFRQEHGLSDLPSDRPADVEGATTASQNTVWKPIGRDRDLERQIRREIRQRAPGQELPPS